MNYFPVMLDVDYKKVVIVGGGHVARQKLQALLPTKAQITIISPTITDEIASYLEQGKAVWKKKYFEPSDLDDASLVFAVTDQESVNDAVEQATQHWQLLSRADAKGRVDFINPAVVRRGDLTLTVSTSGAHPGLTRKLKEDLASQFDDTFTDYIEFLKKARREIIQSVQDKNRKRDAIAALLDSELEMWAREKKWDQCDAYVQKILSGVQPI
ncbi:precorrin-2 dehydrogenase/sirohydrochlorin ferrochelatase family protein [Ureibacillus aquaedulcis]|uniref:precorrin-2 dehydrogenase n=1 Tax=Ureibacillus aquaedulcis TaxID=3058421 RepID=A0ABT8GRC4_9BACL|nr:bifunctional precorrin-2 dehydrogenase/sirohydrochlorin ferrochelatase [Ureibacillus sp. BA0131]MDN4493953.1 bifunctional precorrin-2 dehydrogenase/sirohydrochlorin ferrochelatase [Ureibacillus sp. BA0131]